MHQQNNYQQFPDFTQPPPAIVPSLKPVDDSTIEKFLIDRNHLKIQTNEGKTFSEFKINGRDRLDVIKINLNNLITQQKLDEANLKNNISQISTSLWQEKINLLKLNQIKIVKLLTKFEKLSSGSKAIKRNRQKKRKFKKDIKSHSKEVSKNVKDEDEPVKPQQIEGDLEESYEKFEVQRLRSANLKKLSECKRQLILLDSLIELRCIRRKNSNVSASTKASSEKYFLEQIEQLKSKWSDTLKKCNSLENELNMCLTSSENWLNTLFSNETNPSFHDDTVDDSMHFKKLLDIRKSWDLCLVTDDNFFGSLIPPGWVLPNTTPSNEWASFLAN